MKNELYHYGVLGQKWGVRRYQNSDGSYTSEGKKRYKKGSSSKSKKKAIVIGRILTLTAFYKLLVLTVWRLFGTLLKNLSVNDLAIYFMKGDKTETFSRTFCFSYYGNQNYIPKERWS